MHRIESTPGARCGGSPVWGRRRISPVRHPLIYAGATLHAVPELSGLFRLMNTDPLCGVHWVVYR